MMKWDSRMHNTRSVQVLKVAIPFFDVSEGELIDVEGLLQAIHPLTCGRDRKSTRLNSSHTRPSRMPSSA